MDSPATGKEHVKRLADLYVTYRQRYVLCLPEGRILIPKRKDNDYSKQTDFVLLNHQERKYAVGVFAGKWGSKFLCFDVDDGSKESVATIIHELAKLGLNRDQIHVSFSGRKGYHVEIFFEGIVSTDRLHLLYQHVIQNGDLDPHKVEFRPTHTSAIKLPLSVHAKTGNVCWFVDRNTFEPVENTDYLLQIQPIPASSIESVLARCHVVERPSPSIGAASEAGKASPDTRNLGTVVQQPGTRHNIMRNMVVYMRTHGQDADACRNELERWVAAQDPELMASSSKEISRDIDDLIRWAYSDRFVLQHKGTPTQTRIYASQMDEVLKQKNRSERRILFLLMMRGRMLQPRISTRDIAKATGLSQVTVKKMLHRMIGANVIACTPETRFVLPDGSYSAMSRGYTVPHPAGSQYELHLQLTMKEQMFDFDRSYYCALHTLIPQFQLQRVLSKDEWQEYLNYLRSVNGEEGPSDEERRIDLQGTAHTLVHPKFGTVTVYEVEGRMLYPAYDCAKLLGRQNPSVLGSQCRHKERWQVKMQRCFLADGTPSYQIMDKNFIPAEDVRKLARSSQRLEVAEVCDWILSLENTKKE